MKIAIDAGPLSSGHSVRGVGVYARELIDSLGARVKPIDVKKEDLGKYHLVHLTSFKPFEVSVPLTKPGRTKFALTIYDLIPLIYPKHYPPGVKGWINWQTNKYLIKKNIDAVITISETSKKDICRFSGLDPKKVFVTYLAAPKIFTKEVKEEELTTLKKKYSLPDSFALYLGDINYNKNIPNLIKACKLAKIPLVMVGKQATEIEKSDLNHPELSHLKGVDFSKVIKLGYISYEDLAAVMKLAKVYVHTSFYEGFGIPLIEAVQSGTPIAVTKNQCHVEILGDEFKYVDPKDAEDIAKGILKPNIGKKLPRDYSWEKTADETYTIYSEIAK